MSHSHHHHDHDHQSHGHHAHDHGSHDHRAQAPQVLAAAPTFSLLRLSVWQRLTGAALVLAVLWLMVLKVMG